MLCDPLDVGVGLSVLPGGVVTVVGVVGDTLLSTVVEVVEDTLLTTVADVVGCSLPPAVVVGVNIIGLSLVCIVHTNWHAADEHTVATYNSKNSMIFNNSVTISV